MIDLKSRISPFLYLHSNHTCCGCGQEIGMYLVSGTDNFPYTFSGLMGVVYKAL